MDDARYSERDLHLTEDAMPDRCLVADEDGATAVEYALIIVAIAAVIVLIVVSLGEKTMGLFSKADDNFPTP